MPGLLPDIDPDGLLEYSVVFTDHALNHMSQKFQQVMRDISSTLKEAYQAHTAIVDRVAVKNVLEELAGVAEIIERIVDRGVA